MANRKSSLTGSGQTNGHKPDHGPDSNHWAGSRERAGHRATDPEQCAGPKANRFYRIKGLEWSLLSPTLVQISSSAIASEHSAFRAIVVSV